jgi:zinc protease
MTLVRAVPWALLLAGCAAQTPALVQQRPLAPAPIAAAEPPVLVPDPVPAPAPKKLEGPRTPDEAFRAVRPEPLASQPSFVAPVPVELKLAAGARLLVVESRAVPLVAVEVLIGTGVDGEPAGKAGLAGFTAALLREGTKRHPSQQLAEELDDLAVHLSASATAETSRLRMSCLTEALPRALDLLADVLQEPAFEPADVERVRGLLRTEAVQRKWPAALAHDTAARILWGAGHPWGQPEGGTEESLGSITRDELVRFHDTWYRPGNAIVSVAGDVSPQEIQRLLDARLSGWKAKAAKAPRLPAPPGLGARSITLVDKPGASQSQVWVLGRGLPAGHPDMPALVLANTLLGGSFGSRLNQELREAKGYTYGARSSLTTLREHGLWIASGSIKAGFTAEALAAFVQELDSFASGELRPGELEQAREQAIRALPSQLETVDAVAAAMARLAFHGLPLDEYRRLPEKYAQVTAADLARVVRAHLLPASMPVVVVGPAAQVRARLEGLGLGPVTPPPDAVRRP